MAAKKGPEWTKGPTKMLANLKATTAAIDDHAAALDKLTNFQGTLFDVCVNGVPMKYAIQALLVTVGDEEPET